MGFSAYQLLRVRFDFRCKYLRLKKKKSLNAFCVQTQYGWGKRIRTFGMAESESAALPLGYTPIFAVTAIYIIATGQGFVNHFFDIFLFLFHTNEEKEKAE